MHALDDPVWASLTGPHAALALRSERAARYPGEVSPFAAVQRFDPAALRELAELVPAAEFVALFAREPVELGDAFAVVMQIGLVQMLCEKSVAPPEREPASLASADVAEMLALVDETRPGPFGPRTIEMGRYLGFREGGKLLAMGGERLHPAGHTEVSGICTRPDARGRGLAEAVVRALASSIQARGELPFLHVAEGSPSEATASALYARLGFRERMRGRVLIARRAP